MISLFQHIAEIKANDQHIAEIKADEDENGDAKDFVHDKTKYEEEDDEGDDKL